jgi:hypothetical protein
MADAAETPSGESVAGAPRRGATRGLASAMASLRAAPPWAITWLGIVALIIAIVLSVFAHRPGSALKGYDIQAAILTITAVSLFFTAQVTREATNYQRDRDFRERRERRQALAEAMIVELTELRGQAEHWNDRAMKRELTFVVEYPVLTHALESAELFNLIAVRGLTRTLHQLAELRSTVTNAREVMGAQELADDEARKELADAVETVVRSTVTDIRLLMVALAHERDGRLD